MSRENHAPHARVSFAYWSSHYGQILYRTHPDNIRWNLLPIHGNVFRLGNSYADVAGEFKPSKIICEFVGRGLYHISCFVHGLHRAVGVPI